MHPSPSRAHGSRRTCRCLPAAAGARGGEDCVAGGAARRRPPCPRDPTVASRWLPRCTSADPEAAFHRDCGRRARRGRTRRRIGRDGVDRPDRPPTGDGRTSGDDHLDDIATCDHDPARIHDHHHPVDGPRHHLDRHTDHHDRTSDHDRCADHHRRTDHHHLDNNNDHDHDDGSDRYGGTDDQLDRPDTDRKEHSGVRTEVRWDRGRRGHGRCVRQCRRRTGEGHVHRCREPVRSDRHDRTAHRRNRYLDRQLRIPQRNDSAGLRHHPPVHGEGVRRSGNESAIATARPNTYLFACD